MTARDWKVLAAGYCLGAVAVLILSAAFRAFGVGA